MFGADAILKELQALNELIAALSAQLDTLIRLQQMQVSIVRGDVPIEVRAGVWPPMGDDDV